MKKFLILSAAVASLAVSSCKKESAKNVEPAGNSNQVDPKAVDYAQSALPKDTISGNISTNRTLTADKVWYLQGIVAIDNATLTIEPGTVIVGLVDANNKPGTLVICRHGAINATGTSSAPIIFTSKNLVDGNTFTHAAPGDFGGLILLGQAPVNVANKTIEGLSAIEPFDNRFGGNVANHSSGILKYVRVEFGGYILSEGNEVNGITFGGVGSGTTVDHVQVSYGKDDSFEFFGGTVNCTYLVSVACDDDAFDFDNGYSGTIQYAVAVGDVYATHSASGANSDSNGIEADNNAPAEDGTFALTPKTHPILRNLTIIGAQSLNTWAAPGYLYAARVRRGAEIELYNSIFLGYREAINFDTTSDDFIAGTATVSKVQNNILSAFTTSVTPTTLNSKIDGAGNRRNVFATNSNGFAKITQPYLNNNNNQLNLVPVSSSPATTGGWGAFNNTSRPQWLNTTWIKWYF
ncbi:hypothetical protein EOD41_12065 [Mucilaginibacter limnophilus]|uniref:T9SS C-terminal target domain-containing protein n=1 Tax=Mucilaginibacter limnophilus TaxID=1932778 RepID=A0A3S2Y303_9SPHI|nr:hypothetical protein [Mucilaginibacter limnophilus]RVU00723.1 hypothetical protein EOD41_12065 [Mucilaginibacter limnophilus]